MAIKSNKQLSMQPEDQYTSKDTDHFSALISQCNQQSPVPGGPDDSNLCNVIRRFNYTSNDDAVFNKLMNMDNKGHDADNNETIKVQHFTKVKTLDGYTSRDNENFAALMSFDGNSVDNYVSDSKSQGRTSTDNREFSYTDQDQLNFERLISDKYHTEVDHESYAIDTQDNSSGAADRDVGIIKIIEYDKLKSDRLKSKYRPNENIKICFFD